MSFDSVTFWIFFAIAWTAWRGLPWGLAKSAALVFSLLFYSWWRVEYLVLVLGSAAVDYYAAKRIHDSQEKRARNAWLALSLTSNLGLLAVFKYGPFLAESFSALLAPLGVDPERLRIEGWIVPVGISFYTFQTLSYSIDVHRRRLQPCGSFRDFFLFVSFFPQLVAGPIVRAREFLPQLRRRRRILAPAVRMGLYRVVVGLALKIAIADNLSSAVHKVYDTEAIPSAAEAWLATLYFGTQILADFAGYSSIAIGLGYLLGLRLPENFRYPYIAQGFSEFWSRWHVTLSQWLRDYLYIPLGGNRRGTGRTYVNLMVTMLLGGLWHGAAWTFVVWGAIHGGALAVERALTARGRARHGPPRTARAVLACLARILLVTAVVHIAWVFFRARDLGRALELTHAMTFGWFEKPIGLEALGAPRHLMLVAVIALLHLGQLAHEWYGVRKTVWRRAAVAVVALLLLTLVERGADREFIYFQF